MEDLLKQVKELDKTVASRDEELDQGQCAHSVMCSNIRAWEDS